MDHDAVEQARSMNLFEAYAEKVKPRFERKREIARYKRRQTLRKKADERRQLERQAALIEQDQIAELLTGRYGFEFRGLVDYLDQLSLADGARLVAFMGTLTWLAHAPDAVRADALRLISRAIMALRERAGLPPFDDPIFDQRRGVFQIIRDNLQGASPCQ